MSTSGVRKISRRLCLTALAGVPLLALAIGVCAGRVWHRTQYAVEFASVVNARETAAQDNRSLAARIGEMSARLIQLELDAERLVASIDAANGYQERMRRGNQADNGRISRIAPGRPSGGPMLPPLPRATDLRDPDTALRTLAADAGRVSALLQGIDAYTALVSQRHMSFPGRPPIMGSVLTSNFGNRADPFLKRPAFHSGVDYSAPTGTFIYASAGGRIVRAGYHSEYGNTIEIDHGAGLATRYAHASQLLVTQGMAVMPGQKIAQVGSSGRSTGPHLHFEILENGSFIDPMLYLSRF